MNIRACIFDMGRVLVEFSHERMIEQMAEVCQCQPGPLKAFLIDSHRLLAFERGDLSELEIYQQIEQWAGVSPDRNELNRAASDIFSEKREMIPLLIALKELQLPLVLLSNTSRNHFEFIRERFEILNYFDDYVLSYDVKSLKPEPEIYAAAVAKTGQPTASCFFTDDLLENVLAARKYGLQAEQFFHRDQLVEHLKLLQVPLPALL